MSPAPYCYVYYLYQLRLSSIVSDIMKNRKHSLLKLNIKALGLLIAFIGFSVVLYIPKTTYAAPSCFKQERINGKIYFVSGAACPTASPDYEAGSSKCYVTNSDDATSLSTFDNGLLCAKYMLDIMNNPGARSIPITCPYSDVKGTPGDPSLCPYADNAFGVLNSKLADEVAGNNSASTTSADLNSSANDKATFESCSGVDNCGFIEKLINPAILFLTAGVGIIVTMMIVVAGIQYSSAGSDPQKVASAKSKITNAVIALVAYIFMFGLLTWLWPGNLL